MINRLVLGTVQLGMPYGINNRIGKPDFSGAYDIVKTAFDHGITRFDTSQAYGDSEEILGKVFDKLKINKKVKVFSKLDPKLNLCDGFGVRRSVEDSLSKLKIHQLEGLLIHDEEGLDYWGKGLGDELQKLVINNKVKLIGASFYTPTKALKALDIDGIDIVQVPANILDRRFKDIGVFNKAKECNKGVFVRSIFLQGLLLMDLDKVPESMRNVLSHLERLEQVARDLKLTRQQLAFGYVSYDCPQALIVFGAETSKQVCDNVELGKFQMDIDMYKRLDQEFVGVEERLLNPNLWFK